MTNPIQTQYEDLMRYVRANGVEKTDRTGTGTRSIFGYQMRYDLSKGFPLVTTKKVHLKSIILELLWFLRGDTNVKWLQENGCTIWDEWAREDGSLGPVYGKQWRAWSTGRHIPTQDKDGHVWHLEEKIDQIAQLIEQIKTNPDSRRMMVNAWNVGDLPSMALHPCHYGFQAYVAKGKLSLHVQQRSCDVFLGLAFNLGSYALLTHMLAQQCDLGVGDLIWSGGDVHLYRNHEEQATLQLSRDPFPFPTLNIKRKPDSIDGYTLDDFEVVGYQHHPAIKAPVAV